MKFAPFLVLALLGLGSSASAGCAISGVRPDVPAYRADRDTYGTVTVDVTCDDDTTRYGLVLGGSADVQGNVWGELSGANGRLRFQVLPLPAASLTGLRGSRRVAFNLRLPQGQWGVRGGTYSNAFDVRLVELTVP
ncbi:hypothetical protein [Deinococcus aestuarii]|uniref:hypothetical protein n=1 Tax=Deinococcus aestuarii TaxID=2774531 RepID=UPI001C0E6F56|nr:hypothetical protein [Deinococcus aestuarii]